MISILSTVFGGRGASSQSAIWNRLHHRSILYNLTWRISGYQVSRGVRRTSLLPSSSSSLPTFVLSPSITTLWGARLSLATFSRKLRPRTRFVSSRHRIQQRPGTPCFDYQERQQQIDFGQIMPLFSVPSVTSLSISLPSRDISWFSSSVPTSALTSLHLEYCQVSAQNPGRLLLATPCLKWLEYNAWINVEYVLPLHKRPWEYFDCAEFGRSLAHVQENPEHLDVSISFFSIRHQFIDDRSKFRWMAGRLDTLRGFRKLQRLSMPTTLR